MPGSSGKAMKRFVSIVGAIVLISLTRWMINERREASPDSEPASALALPIDYFHASSALASDDFEKARDSLTSLTQASTGELKSRAEAAAVAQDIAAMRESFKTLTEEVAINMSYPDDYAIAFCPTYKGGTKWIQKREGPIENPYLGKSNETCGFFVD